MTNDKKRFLQPKMYFFPNKKGVDWASPTTLVLIILGILLGLLLLYGIYTKLGGLVP